jgi:hypothetical protein
MPMSESEGTSSQFLKLLDIAERQKHVIEQWRQAQALGPTDDQLWEAELEKITAEFHGLERDSFILKRILSF